MNAQTLWKLLSLRRRLRRHDRWTRAQVNEHQARELRRLREHVYARSPFYKRFHRDLTDKPLGDLPILTKEMVIDHFDEIVTEPAVRLADLEAHLKDC